MGSSSRSTDNQPYNPLTCYGYLFVLSIYDVQCSVVLFILALSLDLVINSPFALQVSKPANPPPAAPAFSYRDNTYNTEQRKAVQSYPTSSYISPTTPSSYSKPEPAYPSSTNIATSYSKPDFGSSAYLDKTEYESVYTPGSYATKTESNLHSSPMASDSPSRPTAGQAAPTYEDRIQVLLLKFTFYYY